jgi:hypothetical protein
MAKYFNFFPTTAYTLANNSTSVEVVTNLMTRFNFDPAFKQNSSVYYDYRIKDGETPEIIADKIYGSSEKHWVILNYNDIQHPQFDWLMDTNSLYLYIDKKYEPRANSQMGQTGMDWASTNVYSYYNKKTTINDKTNKVILVEDIAIDANTYANTATSSTNSYTLQDGNRIRIETVKYFKTHYEYEVDKNEEKRTIKILRSEFIAEVENELRRVVS